MLALFWIGFLGVTAVVVAVSYRRKNLPLAPIGEAADGEHVRLAGAVASDNPLRAPISGRPCTCYRLDVLAQGRRGRERWTFQDAREFRLADPSGTATVPNERVELELSADHIHDTTPARLSDSVRASLERLGVGLDKVSTLQLYEGIVADGDEIEVVGCGTRTPLPDDGRERGFRDRPPSLLELRGAVHLTGARREIRSVMAANRPA